MRELTTIETESVSGALLSVAAIEAIEAGTVAMSSLGAAIALKPATIGITPVVLAVSFAYGVGYGIGTLVYVRWGGDPKKYMTE